MRDLAALSIGDASLALIGGCVRDSGGRSVVWRPGLDVFPISPRLVTYFHSPQYAAHVAAARDRTHCSWDPAALACARALVDENGRSSVPLRRGAIAQPSAPAPAAPNVSQGRSDHDLRPL
jgi:hypothetical protein